MNEVNDVIILGSGPIAASTAYFLSRGGAGRISLITQDPTMDHSATYLYAGGSVRWFWDDKLKEEMTRETGDFIKKLDAEGVDLLINKDTYLFLDSGKSVPALNVSGAKLVNWFLEQAGSQGVNIRRGESIKMITEEDGGCVVKTDAGEYRARKVLCALGVANEDFLPGYKIEKEMRQLFVLDLPVGENEMTFPHTIFPLLKGEAYIFIKHTTDGWRFVVGEEDILEPSFDEPTVDNFQKILEAGLAQAAPFTKKAKVEKILWGIDAQKKTLTFEDRNSRIFAANCGSAVRSCVWIGRTIAEKLKG